MTIVYISLDSAVRQILIDDILYVNTTCRAST